MVSYMVYIKGPAPSLLGTHQRSKIQEIRGQHKGNLHALVIRKKGVFLAEKSAILEIRGDIFNL